MLLAALFSCAGSSAFAAPVYWSVFNIEEESAVGADFVTYANLADMLTDTNRTGVTTVGGFGRNIVGGDSDGTTYWNLFNIEEESAVGADFVTYANLADMLTDTNRTGVATVGGFGRNIVGTGSDGTAYWNLFNIEGESAVGADFVTYANLADMLTDTNRTGVTTVGGFGRNIVGTGAFVSRGPAPVPEPTALSLVGAGMTAFGLARRRRRGQSIRS